MGDGRQEVVGGDLGHVCGSNNPIGVEIWSAMSADRLSFVMGQGSGELVVDQFELIRGEIAICVRERCVKDVNGSRRPSGGIVGG